MAPLGPNVPRHPPQVLSNMLNLLLHVNLLDATPGSKTSLA